VSNRKDNVNPTPQNIARLRKINGLPFCLEIVFELNRFGEKS
jgi:hypothetical protein